MEFHLVQNRKENCQHDHIPFNVKGNENIVVLVMENSHGVTVHVLASTNSLQLIRIGNLL